MCEDKGNLSIMNDHPQNTRRLAGELSKGAFIEQCIVCRSSMIKPFMRISSVNYWRCLYCEATFLHPQHRLSQQEEYEHYLTHENDAEDLGYRTFLSKLFEPMLLKLAGNTSGLDYGCGASSALAQMFMEQGLDMTLYDPFFYPDMDIFNQRFDFISCSEVAEHFFQPAEEFDRLDELVKPGGWIGVMTTFQTDDNKFEGWRYRRDPTHVVFYRSKTFRVIAEQRDWICEIPCKDVVLMRKPFEKK